MSSEAANTHFWLFDGALLKTAAGVVANQGHLGTEANALLNVSAKAFDFMDASQAVPSRPSHAIFIHA